MRLLKENERASLNAKKSFQMNARELAARRNSIYRGFSLTSSFSREPLVVNRCAWINFSIYCRLK